jgi:hypothetical protein
MARYAKFVGAALAALGVVASSGLLDGTAELVLNTIISAAGAAWVVLVPNAPAAARRR